MNTLTQNEFLSIVEDKKDKLIKNGYYELTPYRFENDYFALLNDLLIAIQDTGDGIGLHLANFEPNLDDTASGYAIFYWSSIGAWISIDTVPEFEATWEEMKKQIAEWYLRACEFESKLSKIN